MRVPVQGRALSRRRFIPRTPERPGAAGPDPSQRLPGVTKPRGWGEPALGLARAAWSQPGAGSVPTRVRLPAPTLDSAPLGATAVARAGGAGLAERGESEGPRGTAR